MELYWVHVLLRILFLNYVLLFLSSAAVMAFAITALVQIYGWDSDGKVDNFIRKWLTRSIVCTVVCVIMLIFLPTRGELHKELGIEDDQEQVEEEPDNAEDVREKKNDNDTYLITIKRKNNSQNEMQDMKSGIRDKSWHKKS